MPTTNQIAVAVETYLEKNHELKNHLRVTARPRDKTLIFHIAPGSKLKVNIELGRLFFSQPGRMKERLARIMTYACEFKRDTRIAVAVHAFTKENEE